MGCNCKKKAGERKWRRHGGKRKIIVKPKPKTK